MSNGECFGKTDGWIGDCCELKEYEVSTETCVVESVCEKGFESWKNLRRSGENVSLVIRVCRVNWRTAKRVKARMKMKIRHRSERNGLRFHIVV